MKSGASNIKKSKNEKMQFHSEKNIFDIESSNNELTIEKLRGYKDFENSTEEEAIQQIEIIKKLARILHHLYMHEEQAKNHQNE